jgi:DNA-binding NarL/FixJ family response regulator
MARELHDVLAHSVSVMGVQAGAAEEVLARVPERARPVLRSIQRISRDSIGELRRLLGMLRSDELEPSTAPQPRLDQLDGLIERMRRAGLPVALRITGSRHVLSAGVELTAYRVVQEALTNALKHARPSHVDVVLSYSPDRLEISIDNDGPCAAGNGTGQGLIGMNERVSRYRHPGRDANLGRRLPPRGEAPAREHTPVIRVLIADDQELVRAGCRMILEVQGDIEVVAEASDGAEAVETTRALDPDVVLMDVRMPNTDGIDATRRLALAGDASRRERVSAQERPTRRTRLRRALNRPRGRTTRTADRAPHGRRIRPPASAGHHQARGAGRAHSTRTRCAQAPARGLTNGEIAAHLFLGDATVRTHVSRILSKLNLRDRTQAVVAAYESGLVTPGEMTTC